MQVWPVVEEVMSQLQEGRGYVTIENHDYNPQREGIQLLGQLKTTNNRTTKTEQQQQNNKTTKQEQQQQQQQQNDNNKQYMR